MPTKKKAVMKPTASAAAPTIAPLAKGGLAENAILVHVMISFWEPTIWKDREATNELHAIKNAGDKAGQYVKKLIRSPQLDKARTAQGQLRDFFYKSSLPWLQGGVRILPTATYLDFITKYNEHKAAYDAAADEFIVDYAAAIERAKVELGKLFKQSDYPPAAVARSRFRIRLVTSPIAADDFRASGSESHLDSMQKTIVADMWLRVGTLMKRAAKMLETGNKARALNGAMKELAETLPKLNVVDDPKIKEVTEAIAALAKSFDQDTIKSNDKVKAVESKKVKAVANAADDALKAFEQYMNG